MKKRLFAIIGTLMLLFQCILGSSALAAAMYYEQMPLIEKAKMQLSAGSGLVYAFQFSGNEENQDWKVGSLLGNMPLTLEGGFLKDEKESQGEFFLNLQQNGKQILDALLSSLEGKSSFQSDALLDAPLTLEEPWHKVLLSWLFPGQSLPEGYDNLTFLYQLLSRQDMFTQEKLDPYYTDIDFWLQQYAQEPVYLNAEDEAFMIEFQISQAGVQEGLTLVLDRFFSNLQLGEDNNSALANDVSSNEEILQQNTLLLLLKDQYKSVIQQLTLPEELIFKRYYKSFGNLEKTVLTLPLPKDFMGFSTLTVEMTPQEHNQFVFNGLQGELGISWLLAEQEEKKTTYGGEVFYRPTDETAKILSLGYTLHSQKETVIDDENKTNEKYAFDLLIVPLWNTDDSQTLLTKTQKERYWLQENVEAEGTFTLKSGNSKSNAVYFELEAAFHGLQIEGRLTGEGRSQAPWDFKVISSDAKVIKLEDIAAYKQSIQNKAMIALGITEQIESELSEKENQEETLPVQPVQTEPTPTESPDSTIEPESETPLPSQSPDVEEPDTSEEGGQIIFN